MRKITFLIASLFIMMTAINAQQVAREFVAVEGGTGFW